MAIFMRGAAIFAFRANFQGHKLSTELFIFAISFPKQNAGGAFTMPFGTYCVLTQPANENIACFLNTTRAVRKFKKKMFCA